MGFVSAYPSELVCSTPLMVSHGLLEFQKAVRVQVISCVLSSKFPNPREHVQVKSSGREPGKHEQFNIARYIFCVFNADLQVP
jgi:hypothetical protein